MRQPNRLSKNNRGVTLIEVIAVIAVMSVVMVAITGFMITGTRMSAQVSGGATAGMREQTATEYINQRLWETTENISVNEPKAEAPTEFTKLYIGESVLTSADGVVTYNNVELCRGEIYFLEIDDVTNTITYYLNGTKHVVHLRIAPQP